MKYLSYVARLLLLKTLDRSTPGPIQMDSFRGSRLLFLQEDCFNEHYLYYRRMSVHLN